MVELLERDLELQVLSEAVAGAAAGRGSAVLVFGEAGIGKTSLIERFVDGLGGRARVLRGACDDLSTPRTLGPLHDAARGGRGSLHDALASGDRDRLFAPLLEELSHPLDPTVLVVEDVHWADDATLDVLRYVARRIAGLRAVVVLTYRDDELGGDHPLQRVLGAFTGRGVHRLPLRRLSPGAVARLAAGTGVDAASVLAATGGNPFFVTEALASPTARVPATVADAVLARCAALSPSARALVEQLAVVPSQAERWVVEALATDMDALDEAERKGSLEVGGHAVSFRHELARRAVEESLPEARRNQLNRRVLAVLLEHDHEDLARILHHAVQAADADAIVAYGPRAARQAARAGAHKQAVAHYRQVLGYADRFDARERAALLEGFAQECFVTGAIDDAVTAQTRALELRRELGEAAPLGTTLRWLSRMRWWVGNRAEAEEAVGEAVKVLEAADAPPDLAMAYSSQSQLAMLAHDHDRAVEWGERAVSLARDVGDDATLAHALNNVGIARWRRDGEDAGRSLIEEALEIARRAGADEHVCRAFVNLGWQYLDERRYREANRVLREAVPFAEQSEQLGFFVYLSGMRARLWFETGRWHDAAQEVRRLLQQPEAAGISNVPLKVLLGRIQARTGDPEAAATLADAWALARRTREPHRIGPTGAARAEHAWLAGELGGLATELGYALDFMARVGYVPLWAELGYWAAQAGRPVRLPDSDHPFVLAAQGRWREAAEAWAALGCPYEQAMALADSGLSEPTLEALRVLDDLGAEPLATIVRRRLRRLGVTRVPRGPQPSTRANPVGLTARQVDVLALLAEGLTNGEIADRLVISVRTVDHHVSAILTKLGAKTRQDATRLAAELGVT